LYPIAVIEGKARAKAISACPVPQSTYLVK